MNKKRLAEFRLKGWNTQLYLDVNVWKFKKDLIAYRKQRFNLGGRHLDACVIVVEQRYISGKSKGHLTRKVGEMHFYQACLGTEAITHECLHAALAILRRVRFDFASLKDDGWERKRFKIDSEELLAKITGQLARHLVAELRSRGFYD